MIRKNKNVISVAVKTTAIMTAIERTNTTNGSVHIREDRSCHVRKQNSILTPERKHRVASTACAIIFVARALVS